MSSFNKVEKVLFGLVVLVALGMSWFSMFHLATAVFGLPWILAAGISLSFDGGALWLGMVSAKYAVSEDSGFGVRMATYAFIAASVFLNVAHATVLGYGLIGQVMFGSAPVMAGILLEVFLKFESRQALRQAGRVLDHMPKAGKLAWLRYPKASWRLQGQALKARLMNAVNGLTDVDETHALFADKPKAVKTGKKTPMQAIDNVPAVVQAKQADTQTDRQAIEKADKAPRKALETGKADREPETSDKAANRQTEAQTLLDMPAWLPTQEKVSLQALANACVDNGITDITKATEYAAAVRKSPVARGTMQKAIHRAKTAKAETVGTGQYL
ncbi:DUF2637 domain-containing protein [Streptomyces scabiei]|uniref:DUF2637 domain-containing protein n=1 Tax=Streptomyces scabiei TaxID=1930 RepID=UPI0029A33C07|nr:DUF2637 domain-containing protein [Streptomyces scabiei]MDX2578039.1 DUF2637 domain-containing protein [Streptomyces scabiei]